MRGIDNRKDARKCGSLASSSSLVYDRNSWCSREGRMVSKKKNPSPKRSFANFEEEEEHYARKIQKLYAKMFAATKRTSPPASSTDDDEDEKTKKKRKKRKKLLEAVVDDSKTERLKRFITGEMYGMHMKLVIQKTLTDSDTVQNQNRLNIPINQLVTESHELLTADEKRIVEEGKPGLEVKVVGPTLEMYDKSMRLKKWHMKYTDNWVLKTNWYNFVTHNHHTFKEGTKIQVWSFRKNQQLCFAIVNVEEKEQTTPHATVNQTAGIST